MHTTNDSTDVPAWPVYALTVHSDGRVDASGPLVPDSVHPTRASAIDAVAEVAARLGRPVRAEATEPNGTVWLLAVWPDGAVGELPGGESRAKSGKKRHDKRSAKGAERRVGATAETATRAVPTAIETVAPAVPTAVETVAPAADKAPEPAAPAAHTAIQPAEPTTHMATQPAAPTPHAATELAAPVSAGPATAPDPLTAPDARSGAPALALIRENLEAGQVGRAATLAARLDERAARGLGVSHPDALHIREIRARVTALAGDAFGGVLLYRDVAERWHYRGDGERAEAVAARAEALWMQITDLDTALSAGAAVIRLRNQIPGTGGEALDAALEHRAWLERTRLANVPAAPEHPAPESPVSRRTRTFPTWERPAVDTPTATAG